MMKDPVRIKIDCECWCSIFEIADWGDGYLLSTIYAATFSERQFSPLDVIRRRLKAAWAMLRGKEYRCHELTFKTEAFNDFIKRYQEAQAS